MSQEPPDKKEQAAFFSSLMKEGDNWDEFCVQWCKQQTAARQGQVDPNCSMLCLRRPLNENTSWNPLSGYKLITIEGKESCLEHTQDMTKEQATVKKQYDLGHVWQEADKQAKQLLNDKAIPLYNASVEQLIELGKSPEVVELQDYIKHTATSFFSKVYPLKPFPVDSDQSKDP